MREGFGRAARHIMDFLVRQKARNPNRNISGVNTGRGGGGGKSGRGGDGGGLGTQGGQGEGATGGSCIVIPPQADVDKCYHITWGYYPGATYAKFNSAERQKVYHNKKKYGRDRPDEPRDRGDSTMSELSNVCLMNLEDDLRKITKVTRSTRKRVRAAEEDTSRKDILALSNDDDSLNLSKTASRDNRALGRQLRRGRDRS